MEQFSWQIFNYLTQADLFRLKSVCSKWRDSIEAKLSWKSIFAQAYQASSGIRIRNVKTPARPVQKPKLSAKPKEEKRQWITIPKDIAERLQMTTINRIPLLKRDGNFMDTCERLMVEWADTFNDTSKMIQNNKANSAIGVITQWNDSLRIYEGIIEELNDINVAKIDGIMAGTQAHSIYLHALSFIKQSHIEAKEICRCLNPLEGSLRKMQKGLRWCGELMPLILSGLEQIEMDCKYFYPQRIYEFLELVVNMLVEQARVSVPFTSIGKDAKVLNGVKSLYSGLQAILNCKFIQQSSPLDDTIPLKPVRPSTSYNKSALMDTRPTTATGSHISPFTTIKANEIREMVLGMEAVTSGILSIADGFGRHPDLLELYNSEKLRFDIWTDKENWKNLMYGFRTRCQELEQGPQIIEERGPSSESSSGTEEESSVVTPMWNIK